jgi:hypothetical protein
MRRQPLHMGHPACSPSLMRHALPAVRAVQAAFQLLHDLMTNDRDNWEMGRALLGPVHDAALEVMPRKMGNTCLPALRLPG